MTDELCKNIPDQGFIIACFRDRIIFEPYKSLDGELRFDCCELLDKETPTECHIFDKNICLHMIYRESRNDYINVILTEEEERRMDADLLYYTDMAVREEYAVRDDLPKSLRIINRYRYTEDDTLVLDGYRISY